VRHGLDLYICFAVHLVFKVLYSHSVGCNSVGEFSLISRETSLNHVLQLIIMCMCYVVTLPRFITLQFVSFVPSSRIKTHLLRVGQNSLD